MRGFGEIFGAHQLMAILRGHSPQRTVALATQLWDSGIELIEIPIGTPDGVAALRVVVAAAAERGKRVGAGTVVTTEQVRTAADTGAQYTVAPGLDLNVLAASLAAGLPHLPGVATPTEVHHARAAGCRWLKAFPAASLGPAWIRALRGPYPDVEIVATGGLSVGDVPGFLAAGARIVALGAALADPQQRHRLSELIHA